MITKIDAIRSLVPGAEVVIMGQEILWHVPSEAPVTEQQIQDEIIRLQVEQDSKDYQRKRAAEYPSFADQFDKIFHEGVDAWKAQIQTIKDKYPKA